MLLRAYRGVPDGICVPSEVSFQGILLERRISVLREVLFRYSDPRGIASDGIAITVAVHPRSGGFLRAGGSSVSGGDASTELLPYRLRPPSTGSSLAGEHPGIFPVRRTGNLSGNCFLFRPSSRSRVPPFQEGVPRWTSVASGSLVTAGNCFQASTSDTSGGPSVADLCPGSTS